MAFSRYQFAKKWGVLSQYENPALPVHNEILRINETSKMKLEHLQ